MAAEDELRHRLRIIRNLEHGDRFVRLAQTEQRYGGICTLLPIRDAVH